MVLVVLDQREREHLSRALREQGHSVSEMPSFPEARETLLHRPPRVLVSDIRLGPFNGLHLAILAVHARDTGVILMDDRYDGLLADQALKCVALYLVKPVHPADLAHHVSRMYVPSG